MSRPSGSDRDERGDLGGLQGLPDLLVGGPGPGVEQVGPDGVVEHVGVLGDVADGVLQRLEGHVADVVAADAHRAGLGVVEPGDQVGDRRLAGAGRADQGDHLARLGGEGDVVQHLAAVAGLGAGDDLQRGQRDLVGARVAERDVVELQRAPRPAASADGVGLLLDQRRQVEHLEDPLEADQRGHHVDPDVGEALQRAEQPQQQGGRGRSGCRR